MHFAMLLIAFITRCKLDRFWSLEIQKGTPNITSSDSFALSLFFVLFWSDLGNNNMAKFMELHFYLFVSELFPPNTSKFHLFHQL